MPLLDTPASSSIVVSGVAKRFDDGLLALSDASLTVAPGEFITLIGPSGCGKSTLLRLVAGLDDSSGGTVEAPARQAGGDAATAFVFQDATLMPWASLFDNVWLPLRLAGTPREAAAPRVREVLARVGLADFERAFPHELSGGMRMRASIARALITAPRVLLMDEPFAALDDITRQRLNADLLQWWRQQRMSTIFVTHSVAEAVFLSQRVLVMSARPGRIVTEVAIDEPSPRPNEWRHSAAFTALCGRLAHALEAAVAA